MSDHRGDGYWGPRSKWRYYKKVRIWMNGLSPAGSLCDVGGWDTPVCGWGDFDRRTNINLGEVNNRLPHVRYIIKDFMEFDPDERFDVVSCLQVLEHLEDDAVGPFTQKLLQHATKATIITVPHLWKKGAEACHLQDPVSMGKLIGWAGREPDRHEIIIEDNGCERISALFYAKELARSIP